MRTLLKQHRQLGVEPVDRSLGPLRGRMGQRASMHAEKEFDADSGDTIRIDAIWTVRNDGDAEGEVAGHIIVQERRFFQENSIIEGDMVQSGGNWVPRIRTSGLAVPRDDSQQRRRVSYQPQRITLGPGQESSLTFGLSIGRELLVNKQDLDVVAIIQDLTNGTSIGERRKANLFSVLRKEASAGNFQASTVGEPIINALAF